MSDRMRREVWPAERWTALLGLAKNQRKAAGRTAAREWFPGTIAKDRLVGTDFVFAAPFLNQPVRLRPQRNVAFFAPLANNAHVSAGSEDDVLASEPGDLG